MLSLSLLRRSQVCSTKVKSESINISPLFLVEFEFKFEFEVSMRHRGQGMKYKALLYDYVSQRGSRGSRAKRPTYVEFNLLIDLSHSSSSLLIYLRCSLPSSRLNEGSALRLRKSVPSSVDF